MTLLASSHYMHSSDMYLNMNRIPALPSFPEKNKKKKKKKTKQLAEDGEKRFLHTYTLKQA